METRCVITEKGIVGAGAGDDLVEITRIDGEYPRYRFWYRDPKDRVPMNHEVYPARLSEITADSLRILLLRDPLLREPHLPRKIWIEEIYAAARRHAKGGVA